MSDLSIKQEIVRELDRLPIELQRRVLDFTQTLVLSLPKGAPGKQLLRFAGILEAEDAQAMIQAIEVGCEQVGYRQSRNEKCT
jgi:hypothetical protein